jgi:hypothetical protein
MAPRSRARKPTVLKQARTARRGRAAKPEHVGRYTAPQRRAFGFRPGWHKGVGAVLIVAGVALFLICESNTWGIHDFGGHIWYLVGIAIAASSSWWFGLFDPPT